MARLDYRRILLLKKEAMWINIRQLKNQYLMEEREYTRSFPAGTKEEYLKYLSTRERSVFFAIYLLVFFVAVCGNSAAIFVTARRKHRHVQKTFIISLALTDLIMAVAYTTNYLETFSHPLINWTIGSFMCSFVPFLQMFGVIASSAALVAIALDRYRNVIHAIKQRWNPNIWYCLGGVVVLWACCAGISYPIYTFFELKSLLVLFYDETGTFPLYTEVMYLCLSDQKESLMIYYICIAITIFLPLLAIFLWLYYNIAKLIWEHRKPLSVKFQKKYESSMTAETSSSQLKSDTSSKTLSREQQLVKTVVPRNKNIQVERKIRTFKIIIFLMLAFLLCRLPYWIFNIMKLVEVYNEHKHWIMTYIFNGLALLSCSLNPFLYTFLNQTVDKLTKIRNVLNDFTCKVCCCCLSNTEFEEFEKENPFIVKNCEKKVARAGSPHPIGTERNSRVKFEDVAVVQMYSHDAKTSQECYKDVKKY